MAERAATVTLLTDFGPKDSFIGVMKGVITSIAPGTIIIDLCHAVSPFDVIEAGFLLASSYGYFPAGTIHVAVVDPGVGTRRAILGIRAKGFTFVVPDNGIIVPSIERPEDADEIVRIENDAYFLKPVSATFHGRDIFAAVAAHIGKGTPLAKLGPAVRQFERGCFPPIEERPLAGGGLAIEGEVVHVDHFGNLITNVRLPEGSLVRSVLCRGKTIATYGTTYAEVAPGELVSLRGSSGFLEIAANRGSARELLGGARGEKVHVETGRQPMQG